MTKRYKPENGDEAEVFRQKFCYQCTKFDFPDSSGIHCDILHEAIHAVFEKNNVDDEEYPYQWTYSGYGGEPTCIEFEQERKSQSGHSGDLSDSSVIGRRLQ